MNLKLVDSAIASYEEQLDGADIERLKFFRELWAVQQRYVESAAAAQDYELPSVETALEWYWNEKPLFLMAPLSIDGDSFKVSLEDCAQFLVDNAGFQEDAAEILKWFDWAELVEQTDLKLAGSDPAAYLDAAAKWSEENGLAYEVALLVLSFALRPMLEGASNALMDQMASALAKDNNVHRKPLYCPVCGGKAAAAFVGETPSSSGNGRLLYCATCGCEWEFERIRCATCGTQNQSHLHYFHIEGDEAHRLYNCQECGDYIRTVFQEDLKVPFSFVVEDVVMARLDMVAHDARFGGGEE